METMKRCISLLVLSTGLLTAVACGETAKPTPTPTMEPPGEVQDVAFEELFSDPGQYSGTDILLEGFYFDGWETTVLSERLEPTGFAEAHLWPRGRMVWIANNLIPTEVYDQLYQQEMIGPLERYGKLRIRGRDLTPKLVSLASRVQP